ANGVEPDTYRMFPTCTACDSGTPDFGRSLGTITLRTAHVLRAGAAARLATAFFFGAALRVGFLVLRAMSLSLVVPLPFVMPASVRATLLLVLARHLADALLVEIVGFGDERLI